MAVGNLGATMHQLQGFISSEFASGVTNQGLSLFPEMVRTVASRADLQESNLRVTAPRLFDGTNDVDVEAGAVKLIGIVAQSNASQSEAVMVLLYDSATVTEGTTLYHVALEVPAGGSAATAKAVCVVYPEPVSLPVLSWSVVDNGSAGDIESTGLGDASGVKVMFVYAE